MNTHINGTTHSASIEFEISRIRQFIEEELKEKREIIKQKDKQIVEFRTISAKKDEAIHTFESKLHDLEGETEGNRQLINKLLGDISKLQNDIEWYRRTYEQRSFLGAMKEKISRRFQKK